MGAAEDAVVEDRALGEVGDLGGAADVGGGGEDGVLEDGAEQGVGAEALGGFVENGEEIGGRVRLCGVPCSGLSSMCRRRTRRRSGMAFAVGVR